MWLLGVVDAETAGTGTREAAPERFVGEDADTETSSAGSREAAPERFFSKEVDVETAGHGMESAERLSREAQADELMLMGIRLREGMDLGRWFDLSGRPLAAERGAFLIGQGLIERLGNARLRCTPSGMMVLDAVVADLAA